MKRKRKKVYKRVKLNKYFAPLILSSFFLVLWVICNFQQVSYGMNETMFEKVQGVVTEKTVDGVLSLMPVDKVSYTYKDESYNYELYDIYGFNKDDKIDVYVNKNAPSFIYVLSDNYVSRYNDAFYIIFLICFIVYIRKLYFCGKYKAQRKEMKKSKKEKSC